MITKTTTPKTRQEVKLISIPTGYTAIIDEGVITLEKKSDFLWTLTLLRKGEDDVETHEIKPVVPMLRVILHEVTTWLSYHERQIYVKFLPLKTV